MKKTMSVILGFVLMINMLAIVGSCSEHTYHVYGTIELDGEFVEDADVVVKNLDKSYEESTTTDEDGYYEVYINGDSHNTIKVEVEFDDLEDDDEFETQSQEYSYEVNFEFESPEPSPVKKTYYKVVNMAFGFNWDIWEWLICIFVILMIFCMIKKIFFNGHHHHNNNGYMYRRRY